MSSRASSPASTASSTISTPSSYTQWQRDLDDEICDVLLADDRLYIHSISVSMFLERKRDKYMGHYRTMLHGDQRAALKGHLCIAKDGPVPPYEMYRRAMDELFLNACGMYW